MANTNISLLYPEFWADGFDEFDKGQYPLKNMVNRRYETLVANRGDTVNVPITPDRTAVDWTPGDSITATDIAQTTKTVVLNQSKRDTFTLNGTELSLSAYDLIQNYMIPSIESLMVAVDEYIYQQMLGGTNFTDATAGFTEDIAIDLGTALSDRKISRSNRNLVVAPTDMGSLMKVDAYQFVNQSGSNEVMREGILTRRMGFDIAESNGIATYTPADVAGLVNNVAGYAIGDTTILVDTFDDDVNPIRVGDMVKFADEAGTPFHTITATVTTASDTTSITISPALTDAIANDTAVTITPTRSALAFVPNAFAFAARPYEQIPEGAGVMSRVFEMDGLPIRTSVWNNGNLGINIQNDILYGGTLIDARRLQRAIID